MKIACSATRSQFSSCLDGQLTGVAMQKVDAHCRRCPECDAEFKVWCTIQSSLGALEPVQPSPELALRLRVAISNESRRTPRNLASSLKIRWQNSVAPFLLQASAGLASAVVLIGTVAMLIGMFASPEPVAARDQPLGSATGPRLLYSSLETDADAAAIGERENPVIVEAYIDGSGKVYDYHIVSGANDAHTRSEVENLLLFSIFEPARFFGQPVRGLAVLSFAGVSVHA